MLYDLDNDLHREQFKARCNKLYQKRCVVELTERKPQRTSQQNRYLHVVLGYFGSQFGMTVEEVKRDYFKTECNRDLFVETVDDPICHRPRLRLRSSASLTTEEMTLAIERFRDWASKEAGIYIPSPDEHRLIQLMEIEVERNRQYL